MKDLFKKIFRGAGYGGLILGGGFLSVSFFILQFLFTAGVGLSMIWWAITLFSEHSIVWGLTVFFIATPVAIGLSFHLFIFLLFLTILALIIWGIAHLFGFNISFDNAYDSIWLIIKLFVVGGVAFFGVSLFTQAVKERKVSSFFKENWLYILVFFFFVWWLLF